MKKLKSTEEQVIGVLKEAEAKAKTADLAWRHGVLEAAIYDWKSKYGGWRSPRLVVCGSLSARTPS